MCRQCDFHRSQKLGALRKSAYEYSLLDVKSVFWGLSFLFVVCLGFFKGKIYIQWVKVIIKCGNEPCISEFVLQKLG